MTRMTWFQGFAGLAGALMLAGCGPQVADEPPTRDPEPLKIDAAKASLTANVNIADHLDGIAATIKVLEESNLLDNVFPRESPTDPCPEPPNEGPPPPCDSGSATSELDLTNEVADIKEWLAENVFAASAVESQTETSVTYRIKPEAACPEREDEGGAITRDETCVKVFTQVPFRIVATSLAEGDLDLALKVGETNPATMELYRAKLSATADLAQVKAAMDAVAVVTEEDLEGFPERFTGKVKVAVTKNAVHDYTAKVSTLTEVNVGTEASTSHKHVDVKVAPATDALTVQLNADSKTLVSSINFANIDVAVAANLLFGESAHEECEPSEPGTEPVCNTVPEKTVDGLLALHLGGVNAAGTFQVENDSLSLTNVGLGNDTSTVKFNGAQVLALDINAAAGRRFDFAFADGETNASLTVKPQLSVTLAHDLTALAAAVGEENEIPAFLKGGSSTVTFDGAAEPKIELIKGQPDPDGEEGPQEGTSDKVKVSAGTLTLDSSTIDPIVIAASQCISESNAELPEGAHPFQSVAGGSCE